MTFSSIFGLNVTLTLLLGLGGAGRKSEFSSASSALTMLLVAEAVCLVSVLLKALVAEQWGPGIPWMHPRFLGRLKDVCGYHGSVW